MSLSKPAGRAAPPDARYRPTPIFSPGSRRENRRPPGRFNEIFKEKLVKVNDISGKEVVLGSRVARPAFVDFCEHMPEKISSITNMEISRDLFTPSSMSSEMRTIVNSKWELLLSTDRPIDTQGEILKKIVNEKIEPGKINEIEYVDLRIKGRATYKLRGEEGKEEKDEDEKEDGED